MYHQHFNTIDSTQIYLKNHLEQLLAHSHDILISSSEQTGGIGRSGNRWDNYSNSLAMSFTITPNIVATLTPIEIGVITAKFFRKIFNKELFLKWPNDLLTKDGKKCGGILCQYIDSSTVIVGLGINLGKHELIVNHEYRYSVGSVDQQLEITSLDQEKISNELYQFILGERFRDNDLLKKEFNKLCYHLNKEVFILDAGVDHLGIFKGIGENGEALVEQNSHVKPFINSSLTIIE